MVLECKHSQGFPSSALESSINHQEIGHEIHMLTNIADRLVESTWAEIPNFLSQTLTADLRTDSDKLFAEGSFRAARIGRAQDLKTEKRIRSDEILWFEPDQLTPAQSQVWTVLEDLRRGLNEQLYLGLNDFEAHYARYEPGQSYGKHVDRFASSDARTVSVVLYLNEEWLPTDGGELVLHPAHQPAITITPEGGKLVCFLSADLEHEVLSSPTRTRKSIAAWFRKQKSPIG